MHIYIVRIIAAPVIGVILGAINSTVPLER